MYKFLISILWAGVLLLLCQCSPKQEDSGTPDFNEFVSAYTSGTISRKTEVRIIFSQDIPEEKLQKVQADAIMRLTPKAEGKFAFANSKTLVFTPAEDLKRDTPYSVKVDLDKLFDKGGTFEFNFRTRPFAIGGSMKSFDETSDGRYEITYNIITADVEDAKLIDSHLQLSKECDREWTHAADGLTHQLKARVAAKTHGKLELTTVQDNTLDIGCKVLATVDLPNPNILTVVSTRCKHAETKCIEITFNKNLDEKQNIKGLVYIEGKKTQATAEGNKVTLQSNLREGEHVNIIIDKALRSRNGDTPEEQITIPLTIEVLQPQVAFVGDGNILPQSDRILVPFKSVHMRGVRVMVFKIFSNMVGSLLQRGDLFQNNDGLIYAARPIAATTFFIDNQGTDLSEWHTYAIDLTDQVKLEPGAMYRIELSLDARLSDWESDTLPHATPEEMAIADAQLLDKMASRFDTYSYYYTGMGYDERHWWADDYYRLRKDPGSPYFYEDKTIGKNVLATNIGLSANAGADNVLNVTAINLPDTKPLADVEVELFNKQQQPVAKGKTQANGIATLTYNARQGKPVFIRATKGNDVSYMNIDDYQALNTSTFDVSGNQIERGLKGFIYGERGVWRPGDTLHIGFMLNDRANSLPKDHPVTLTLFNPLGQEVNRLVKTSGTLGLYAFNIPTAEDAPTGIWSAQVNVGGVTFSKNLRIETIKPNRLKIDLTLPDGPLANGTNKAEIFTEWLNGSKASGLKYDINATIVEAKTSFDQYKDYLFDDQTKQFETSEQELKSGNVGESGKGHFDFTLNTGKTAPGMLKCNLVTHVYEPSGEFSTDVTQALVAPYSEFVGIKAPAQTKQSHLDTDKNHTYSLVCVDKNGKPVRNASVDVNVYKVDWYWWWRSTRYDMVGYTSSSYHTSVKDMKIRLGEDGTGTFQLNFSEGNWGTYLIVAKNGTSGHSTSVLSYFDWPWMTSRRSTEGKDNASALSLTTDKKEYAPGEKIHLNFPSELGSRAIIAICNGSKILHMDTYECAQGNTEIALDVTEEMTPNVYIAASLVQRYDQTVNDMPIRLYGIIPVQVSSPKSHLSPVITCNDEFRPMSTVQVKVSEKEGRPMAYTLAVVDEGLLDLTHFKTPDAWALFNAREALGVRFWDFYDRVNGAYGGRIEQLFSIGGDDALNNGPKAIVNRFRPMVYFAGPFELKKGETRTHDVSVPNYNGRVRAMVVAGDGMAYGNAEKSVIVRSPLMMIGTMPRQIGVGDEMAVSATVFASQKMDKVKVTIEAANGLNVVGESTQTLTFAEAGDQTVQFRIKAEAVGKLGRVALRATSGNEKTSYIADIALRTVSQTLREITTARIEPNGTFEQSFNALGQTEQTLMVDVAGTKPLNLISRLSQLLAYPHGCVEQTTSKAFPQLCLSDYCSLSAADQQEAEENVKRAIDRLKNYQTAEGGMSYWPNGKYSNNWASAYVLHFFLEASARGYYVPDDMQRRLKSYVTLQVNNWSADKPAAPAAYSLYVLAKMQKAEQGAMNRMKENAKVLSEGELCLLGAAYALNGQKEVCQQLTGMSGRQGETYWFPRRVAKLLAHTYLEDNLAHDLAEETRLDLLSDSHLSTASTALSLIAMGEYYKRNNPDVNMEFTVSADGKKVDDIKTAKKMWNKELAMSGKAMKLSVKNLNKGVLYLTATTQGLATQCPVEAAESGLQLAVTYLSEDGSPLDPSTLTQSTTFKAHFTIRNTTGKEIENVAITHIVPAGWEILGTQPSGEVSYQDQRDDRLLSYIDRFGNGKVVTIDLHLSATYSGQYYMPSIHAEAMYDATISGRTASSQCVVK